MWVPALPQRSRAYKRNVTDPKFGLGPRSPLRQSEALALGRRVRADPGAKTAVAPDHDTSALDDGDLQILARHHHGAVLGAVEPRDQIEQVVVQVLLRGGLQRREGLQERT